MYYRNKGGNVFCPKFCPLLILKTKNPPSPEDVYKFEREISISCLPYTPQPTGGSNSNLDMCPDQESNPQPFWCEGLHSNQLSHLAGATFNTFLRNTTYFCIFKGITCLKKLAHTKQMITNVLGHKQHLIIGLTIWLHNLSYFLL